MKNFYTFVSWWFGKFPEFLHWFDCSDPAHHGGFEEERGEKNTLVQHLTNTLTKMLISRKEHRRLKTMVQPERSLCVRQRASPISKTASGWCHELNIIHLGSLGHFSSSGKSVPCRSHVHLERPHHIKQASVLLPWHVILRSLLVFHMFMRLKPYKPEA